MTSIQLSDGRALEYEATGPGDGFPLLMHHGTPGSLARFRVIEAAAHRRGLRMVTYSRAGYGGSERRHGRAVVDVAADVAAVLDDLGAERCLTMGWSGGGPHVLATAARLPERVAAVTVIAGAGPYGQDGLDFLAGMGKENIEEFGAALAGEETLAPALEAAAGQLGRATLAELVEIMSGLLPEADRAALAGTAGEDLAANFAEAVRGGAGGWIDDDLAFVRPWGFELDEIAVPVFLWQGEEDLMVPVAHGRWLAERIPGVVPHLLPGEGHLSVCLNHLDAVLDELISPLR